MMIRLIRSAATFAWLVGYWAALPALPQQASDRQQAWTREEALNELKLRPRDPYVQYVAAQLGLRDGTREQVRKQLEPLLNPRQRAAERNRSVDLFSIFSGSLAIQESLQLDALTQPSAAATAARKEPANVMVSSLEGPDVESHPWTEMLGGEQPELSMLEQCVPADQLYVRFESVSKLLQMRHLAEDYAAYVSSQTQHRASSAGLIDRAQKQLAIETSPVLQPLYDAAIAEIALTSSDLYFREGTDIALIMRLNETRVIRSELDNFLKRARQSHDDAQSEDGEYLGVPFQHVRSGDRALHVFSAYPKPNLHVRTNSRIALERVLSAILNEPYRGRRLERLSDTDEFRYIRTLMPLGAEEEDGLVYMSDPFIRKLIGAEKKLTQRSRLVCRSHLQMIAYAGLLFQTQFGRRANSTDELHDSGCLGVPDEALELRCPSGGEYRLSQDGLHGECSHHGNLHAMVPCNEIPLVKVSEREAEQYHEFEEEYSQYWRTFFDPIAIRLKHSTSQTRIETIVLPLINNTIYQGLAAALGGEPEMLDSLPIPKRNIFSVALKLDKQRLLSNAGIRLSDPSGSVEQQQTARLEAVTKSLWNIALAMHHFHDTFKHFPPRAQEKAPNQPSGLSWRVHILPFIEQGELYNQFKLDEPWDSQHNRPLVERMPEIFGTASPELAKQGKTRLVRPLHPQALYRDSLRGTRIAEITDGTSNTILAVVADEEQAVTWTKPDDLEVNLEKPQEGWSEGIGSNVPVVFADGSARGLPRNITAEQTKALLTRAGGEVVQINFEPLPVTRNRNQLRPVIDELDAAEFLYKGLGNQIAIHVCDADPLVDFSVARFLGMAAGTFNGRNRIAFDESAMFVVLGMALNVPVYISAPVQDEKIVDAFLERLDGFLAQVTREQSQFFGGFFSIEHDFYEVESEEKLPVRAYAFHFGPLTWRFYWLRIGDGLYLASKPFIIGELRAAIEQASRQAEAATEPGGLPAHGLVRVRPLHWDRVKSHYRIGWAESERLACLGNLGPLADLGRAQDDGQENHKSQEVLHQLAQAVFGLHYRCPAGGEYHLDADHAARCSVHGSLAAPQQPTNVAESRLIQLADALRDAALELRFLEDGLHAVVTIERDPRGIVP